MSQRNLLILMIAIMLSYFCYLRGEQNPFARYVSSSYELIENESLIETPDDELYASAVEGMVKVLERYGDEHSRFITAEDARAFQAEMRQQFGGIGVRIRIEGEPPRPTVVGPPEAGTPAFRADIRAGDIITQIDGQPTENWDMLQVLSSMRGEVGESLSLTVLHSGETDEDELELLREVITIDSILGDQRNVDGTWDFQLPSAPSIGYVRLIHFGDKTVSELTKVLSDLKMDGKEALLLDLRDNSGGALEVAVAVSNMFLPKGALIVETRGRDSKFRSQYLATRNGEYQDWPMAVLINQYSASASEIVAACLQDHQRATIIGERSYGKGTVQRVLGVGPRGDNLLKLTAASYWRPSGKNIHRMKDASAKEDWGVIPNEERVFELDDKQYSEYRLQRSQRDITKSQQSDSASDTESLEENESGEFIDLALLNAVDCLQSQLAK